jgi:hypothetical protein
MNSYYLYLRITTMKYLLPLAAFALTFSCNQAKPKQITEPATDPNYGQVIRSADSTRKNLIQENLFEEKDFLHGFTRDQSCCDYSIQQVNGALRFELRKTDPEISRSKRAEVTGKGYTNEERWYGFRLRLEDWVYDDAGEHLIQWHPNDSRGSANVSLWTSSGMYTLVISPNGSDNFYYPLDTIVSGKPADFVLHIKWSAAADGFVEVWKDGKKLTMAKDKPLPYRGITSSTGCYLKLGINKFGWSYEPAVSQSTSEKRIFYFEEYREGNEKARYEDVRPGK